MSTAEFSLGIDTGGTYTDGVLLDLCTGEIVRKAKAFTTRDDLSIGIRECIYNLNWPDTGQIRLVSLSTTLATNSIVENRGCRVGLLLIGHQPSAVTPAESVVVVSGGHDIKGNEVAKFDSTRVRTAFEQMKGKVDTVAISGYSSVRNPEHELKALEILGEVLDVPAVCAHQLTSELGFWERTVTACLNARLLPVIAELIAAIKIVLQNFGIKAPLMVVKGDGSLISETLALQKPVETILSGPAASIVGASFLTGISDALILDMGGTTTDIAVLQLGKPRIKREGAIVGGWKTLVEAAQISTFGLGGDSYIQVSPDKRLSIGPKRVWPISVLAARHTNLLSELSKVNSEREIPDGQPLDCWFLLKSPTDAGTLTQEEVGIIRILCEAPLNVSSLASRMGIDVGLLPLKRLENMQFIGRTSLTPTDILHALGKFTPWNSTAAVKSAKIQARRMKMDYDEFLSTCFQKVLDMLGIDLLASLLNNGGSEVDLEKDSGAKVFLERFLAGQPKAGFGVQIKLSQPIVAIGAPVSTYLPAVGEKLNTQVLIPTNAEVANAVGAAVGKVIERIRMVIKPGVKGGFVVYGPWGRDGFTTLVEAESYAVEQAKSTVQAQSHKAGAFNPEIIVDKQRVVVDPVFVETRISVNAIGRPRWEV